MIVSVPSLMAQTNTVKEVSNPNTSPFSTQTNLQRPINIITPISPSNDVNISPSFENDRIYNNRFNSPNLPNSQPNDSLSLPNSSQPNNPNNYSFPTNQTNPTNTNLNPPLNNPPSTTNNLNHGQTTPGW